MPNPPPDFYSLGEVSPRRDWHMAAHWHGQYHELIVVLDGAMRLCTPKEELVARRGDLLFYPATLVHEETSLPDEPVHTLFLCFSRPDYGSGIPLRQSDQEGRVRQIAGWLQRDLAAGRSTAQCHSLYAALLGEVARLAACPADAWVQAVRTRFQARLGAKHTLASVARQAGMSRYAFARKYKRLAGCTPMAELRRLRLQAAHQRLLSGTEPLKVIASAVGLGDEFQLSKLFRRYFKVPPSQLRSPFRWNSTR